MPAKPKKRKKTKCLLLVTQDNRRFFTYPDNLHQLIEFSKTFGAEMSIVSVESPELLNLSRLAPAICDPHYSSPPVENIEILDRWPSKKLKTPSFLKRKRRHSKPSRKQQLKLASAVRRYIEKQFKDGKIVCMPKVQKHFAKYKLKSSTLSNHLRVVRGLLTQEGLKVIKKGVGQYSLKG